jgi:hypothetical protein
MIYLIVFGGYTTSLFMDTEWEETRSRHLSGEHNDRHKMTT